eukprot:Filipodium_phascolosomae@DN5663_c0_g1_i1.p1
MAILLFETDQFLHRVTDNLYVSSIGGAMNWRALKAARVTHILCAAKALTGAYPSEFNYKKLELLDVSSFSLCKLPSEKVVSEKAITTCLHRDLKGEDQIKELEDLFVASKGDKSIFENNLMEEFGFLGEALHFMHTAINGGGRVLVHCFAGRSRSVSIIVAYLILSKRMTLKQAFETVLAVRPEALPNSGFLLQLSEFYLYILQHFFKSYVSHVTDPYNRLKLSAYITKHHVSPLNQRFSRCGVAATKSGGCGSISEPARNRDNIDRFLLPATSSQSAGRTPKSAVPAPRLPREPCRPTRPRRTAPTQEIRKVAGSSAAAMAMESFETPATVKP